MLSGAEAELRLLKNTRETKVLKVSLVFKMKIKYKSNIINTHIF